MLIHHPQPTEVNEVTEVNEDVDHPRAGGDASAPSDASAATAG